ncbi:MAG: hypothetical protein V1495_06240 [Pseudomonadota bacterium]
MSEGYRYERVNARPGFVVIEEEGGTGRHRAYFAEGSTAPREDYQEGGRRWSHVADAQSVRFDLRDTRTGEVTKLDELLGLMYFASAKPGSDFHKIGELALGRKIHVYVAVTAEGKGGVPKPLSLEKLQALTQAFNERLLTQNKMIVILPDHFDVYRHLTFGEIMVDFGMTSMEANGR